MMSPIKVFWRGQFVGIVAPSGTYAASANVKYQDRSRLNGSMSLIVSELRIPDAAHLREVYALDILFDRDWYENQPAIPEDRLRFMRPPEPTPDIVDCDPRLVDMCKENLPALFFMQGGTGSTVADQSPFWLSEAELDMEFEFAHVAYQSGEVHIVFQQIATKNLMAVVLKGG